MSHKRPEVGYSPELTRTKTYKPIPAFTPEQVAYFWGAVDKSDPNGCWIWLGATRKGSKGKNFYGVFSVGRDSFIAHRVSYTLLVGPIPDGHTLDHLRESGICTSTLCINPAHTEPVTQAENTRRYCASLPRICKRGHRMAPKGNCQECIALKLAEWKERNRENLNQSRREWYAANRDKIRAQRKANRERRMVAA